MPEHDTKDEVRLSSRLLMFAFPCAVVDWIELQLSVRVIDTPNQRLWQIRAEIHAQNFIFFFCRVF